MPHILFGHRGARGEAPENTLSGFAYAQRAGVLAFELDVHMSADGLPVVIHDSTVDRTTDGRGPVAGYTAAELARLDARAGWPSWPEPAGVPLLSEVLAVHHDARAYQIEIKTHVPADLERLCPLVAAEIARAGIGARTTVTSFDPCVLEIMGKIAPGQAIGYIGAFDGPGWITEARHYGCQVACAQATESSPEMVRELQRAGLHVTGWIGNTEEELLTLLAWGVDSITSDYPSMAMPFLRDRGWLGRERRL